MFGKMTFAAYPTIVLK